jgi:hypothetical protein
MKHIKRILITALVCVMMCLLVCPAFAAVDVDAPCSLYVDFQHEDSPMVGAQFRLYRVADMDSQKKLTLTGVYTDMVLDPGDLTGTALQLAVRAESQQVPADFSLTTNEEGLCGTRELRPGAYLLIGDPIVRDDRTHYVDPQLIILPHASETDGSLGYHVTLRPKTTDVPAQIEPIDITVVKVWEDKKYQDQRPTSIQVHLLKNGKTVDTVMLSEENQWTYTWTGLIPNADWSVEEDVPDGYTCETKEWGNVFTLTNYRKDIDQTGHIWWPVIALLCAGFIFVVTGIIVHRSGKHEA